MYIICIVYDLFESLIHKLNQHFRSNHINVFFLSSMLFGKISSLKNTNKTEWSLRFPCHKFA